MAQQRSFEAGADEEAKHWERRILTLLFVKLTRSLHPNDYSHNMRINGLIRLTERR